jgi:glycosyltransferase involved in cell wall biosynthesis
MLKLGAGLVDHGCAVDLVLAKAQGPFLKEIPDGLRTVDLESRRVLTSIPRMVRYLRRERPNTLLSVLHANLIAIWSNRMAGDITRVVVSERNTLSSERRQYSGDKRMIILPLLVRMFYPWADSVIAVSNGVKDDLVRSTGLSADHIHVVYNPIITEELKAKAVANIHHPWLDDQRTPVLVSVGRLTPQKDFLTLLRAFALVRQTCPAKLMIIGDGEEREKIEGLIRRLELLGDVELTGYLPNPYPYIRRSALFVLSSKYEGLPGVLIEAMYCGVPLIATDCPSGPREILDGGRHGRLVPVGDPETMASAIREGLRGGIRKPSPDAWQPFSSQSVIRQYLSVLLGDRFGDHAVGPDNGRLSAHTNQPLADKK